MQYISIRFDIMHLNLIHLNKIHLNAQLESAAIHFQCNYLLKVEEMQSNALCDAVQCSELYGVQEM